MRIRDCQIECANPARAAKVLSASRRSALLAHWDYKCAYCQDAITADKYHADHVIDGPHKACHHSCCNLTWNIAISCPNCNIAKGHHAGNWAQFVAHSALDLALANGADIQSTIASELSRFTSKLYSEVVGFTGDMAYMIDASQLLTAYTLTKDGDNYIPANTPVCE